MAHMPTFANSSQPATVANDEATPILICAPVYSDSATGVKRASAASSATSNVVGLVSSSPSIAAGAVGTIVGPGEYFSATTAQWDAIAGTTGGLSFNTIYYLNTTAGTLTRTAPLTPNVTEPVLVALSPTTALITLAGGGSGGGGITNSAGANVVMKSDGTNAVASSISDDGTKVLFTKQIGVGSAVPFAYRLVQITNADPTLEECLWIEDNATAHVGTGGQNQAIALVLREQGTTNTTTAPGTATCIDAAVTQTISAGANPLTNTAVLANATGGTTNYSWFSSNGQMVQTGDAHMGNVDCTGTLSCTTTFGAGGAATIGGNLTASGIATLGPSATTGKIHTVNGNIALRSPDADTYLNIKNNSAGGRDWFLEASGNGGTDPNCIAIYDNTAAATRFKITSGGDCVSLGKFVATSQFQVGTAGSFKSGTLTPNTNVIGSVGDLYTWTGGGAGTTLWVKESGSATNTGWVSK